MNMRVSVGGQVLSSGAPASIWNNFIPSPRRNNDIANAARTILLTPVLQSRAAGGLATDGGSFSS
jgi:hypothetical protein